MSNGKNTQERLPTTQAWPRIACYFALAALLAGLSTTVLAKSHLTQPDADDLVRKALANYKARLLKAKDYKYLEIDFVTEKLFGGKLQDSELYELIPLGSKLHRRHLAHNGKPLSPQEEKNEQQRLEDDIQRMEENFARRVEDPDAKLPDDGPPPGTPVSEVMFDAPFESWQLDLESLPAGFVFRPVGEEISDGHKLLVIAGKPTSGAEWPQRGLLDLQNFDLKFWIDEEELEIVRLEAHANKKGLLARPLHAIVNKSEFPGASGKEELNSLYESTLWYQRGTVITRTWKKVNDEVWLPASLQVKGKESHEQDYPNGDHASGTWKMEQQTLYSGYRKFRVSHRILPNSETLDPSLQEQQTVLPQ